MKMLQELADICRKNLLNEKILIVNSFITGQNVLRSLSLTCCNPLNLRIQTVQSLAEEIAGPAVYNRKLTPIDDRISQNIVFGILLQMHRNNEFEYFRDMEITPSVSGVIWNAMMEMKYACVDFASPVESGFISLPKGRDIRRIYSLYESELENSGLIDAPGILKLAGENAKKSNAIPVVPFDLKLRSLERELLEKLFPNNIKVIYDEPLNGLDTPSSYYRTNDRADQPTESQFKPGDSSGRLAPPTFSYLYDIDHLPAGCDLSRIRFARAYGENNEVRAILRNIKAGKIPCDEVCVYTTVKEPYAQIFYQQAAQFGIPVTFGYGVNIANTRAGQLVLSMTQWIRNGFQVMDLYKILQQGLLKFPNPDESSDGAKVSPYQVANELRASGIGWGRERYLPKLDEQIAEIKTESLEPEGYSLRKLQTIETTEQFIQNIFDKIPEGANGTIAYQQLCRGLSDLLKEYAEITGELEAEAKAALIQAFDESSSGGELEMKQDEALKYVENTVQSIRVGVSGPKPGCLHLCGYNGVSFIPRKYHFVIGMDSSRLPGRAMEDPILLDIEKERLSKDLALNRNKSKENLYAMAQLLARLEGNITLSYSSFDPVENREKSASPLLLQAYRMICRDPSRDYADLRGYLNKAEGYIQDEILEENEFWLGNCYNDAKTSNLRSVVHQCYGNLRQGGTAWEKRTSTDFTSYDGYIGDSATATDEKVFSATSLETLAQCPYKYYLGHILRVSPPDEAVYDPETWLDAKERGTLYHKIFEQFYKTISKKGDKPSRERHFLLLYDIADGLIAEKKDQIPPPSQMVYEYERNSILESCNVFLAIEEEYAEDGIAEYFELEFGTRDDKNGFPPVKIDLPSGNTMLLSGKIDRVDHLVGNTYRIVDYKSGSAYGYSDREHFKKGRHIQHALYSYAFETLMREQGICRNASVVEGMYIFPTRKGEGKRYVRRQKDHADLKRLLDDLLTIIRKGVYPATDEEGDCNICDYKAVCRYGNMRAVIKEKRNDEKVEGLDSVRRLKDYE